MRYEPAYLLEIPCVELGGCSTYIPCCEALQWQIAVKVKIRATQIAVLITLEEINQINVANLNTAMRKSAQTIVEELTFE